MRGKLLGWEDVKKNKDERNMNTEVLNDRIIFKRMNEKYT